MREGTRAPSVFGCILAGSLALAISACGSDDEGGVASPPSTPAEQQDTSPTVPSTTPPRTEETVTRPSSVTATTSPPATTAPEPTVPAEPVPVRDNMYLTAGWSYASRNLALPLTFAIPESGVEGRWRLLFDTGNYIIVTLNVADKPEVEREEPGFVLYAVPEAVTPDDFVAAWTTYAAEQEAFTAEAGDGVFLGSPAAVISGTYVIDSGRRGASFLQLGDSMRVPTAPGERTYVAYVVAVGDRTLVVLANAHALEFDMTVTLVNQIVETLEFAEAGT